MESTFNPYLKWLGIPLKDQPPSHYRLLGVELFEADPDIIERAADRQMVYLRSLQTGEHGKHAERLLNEIAAAKVCLLDAKRKKRYDDKLRSTQPDVRPAVASGSSLHLKQAVPLAAGAPPVRASAPPPMPAARRPSASSSGIGIAPTAGVTLAAIAVEPTGAPYGPGRDRGRSSPFGGLLLILLGLGAAALAGTVMLVGFYFLLRPAARPRDVANQPTLDSHISSDPMPSHRPQNTAEVTPAVPTAETPDESQPNNETGPQSSGGSHRPNTRRPTPSRPKPPQRSHLAIAGQVVVGQLQSGANVASDGNYRVASVDSQLDGLEFARVVDNATLELVLSEEQAGATYVALAPGLSQRNAAEFVTQGWKLTDMDFQIDEGGTAPVRWTVYELPPLGSRNLKLGWSDTERPPVLIAHRISKQTRVLGEVVDNGRPPQVQPPITPIGSGGDPDPAETETTPPVESVAKKLPVPDRTAQQPVRDQINRVFELASLRDPQEKQAAARKILSSARSSTEDPTERYVMLAAGSQLAADAGDLRTALEGVDDIEKGYDGDASAMRLYLAGLFAKAKVPPAVKVQQLALLVPVIDEGLQHDHFDAIDSLVKDLLAANLRHPELAARRKLALEMRDSYRKVAAAKSILEKNPADGPANTIVGQYYALYKSDWDEALPYLAKSDDANLSATARLDLADPKSASEQLAIANGWYDAAQLREDAQQEQGTLLVRAETWYTKAAAGLKGLDEAHARKRLDDVQSQLKKIGWVDVPRLAVIAAAGGYGFELYVNGQQLMSHSTGVYSAQVTLKRGDVIAVRARRSTLSSSRYGRGFACVIAFQGLKSPVVTGRTEGWRSFTPRSSIEWSRPDNIQNVGPIAVAPDAEHVELAQQTGVVARGIWSTDPSASTAYLVYVVP